MTTTTQSPQGAYFLRLPGVLQRIGLSRTAIYKRIAEGSFPAPVKLGPRASAWRVSDLDAWAEKQGAKQ